MTGYPPININPYNMYQNWGYGYQYPAFRGVQNQPQPVSAPQLNVNLQTSPDTVNFKATEHIQAKPKKEGLSTGAKWAIGLGLTALASYGIYALTKGRAKGVTPMPENPIPEIKEMAIDAFQRGKDATKEGVNRLVNGKAILADGTNYTGKIVSESKDGSKVVMEYLDGVLQKSTKTKGAETIFKKTYKYSKELGLEEVIKNDKTTFKKYIDKAGNLNITTPKHDTIIDKPSGLVSIIDGMFIDKQKNILGEFKDPHLVFPINSYWENPIYKIRGVELPTWKIRSNAATDFNNNNIVKITWGYTGRQPKSANKFEITERYSCDKGGKGKRIYIDFEMKYGKYKSLDIDLKSGLVRNGDSPLFKYNYRTNEITDLKIDKKEAEELVNFAKEQYEFYQKAQKARLREYACWS
jgi:hypothetical protein